MDPPEYNACRSLDNFDAFMAGWSSGLTQGSIISTVMGDSWSNLLRARIYGETATRNHRGTWYDNGQGVGFVHAELLSILMPSGGGGRGGGRIVGQWQPRAMPGGGGVQAGGGILRGAPARMPMPAGIGQGPRIPGIMRAVDPNKKAQDVLPARLRRKFPSQFLGNTLNELRAMLNIEGANKAALNAAIKILNNIPRLMKKIK